MVELTEDTSGLGTSEDDRLDSDRSLVTEEERMNYHSRTAELILVQANGFALEWFLELLPWRTPYFPQVGDGLVYFRQGHERYMRLASEWDFFPHLTTEEPLPYMIDQSLPPEIDVRVVDVSFELQPFRSIKVKLERINRVTGQNLGTFYSVRYRYQHEVDDFLVLRQIYDKSVRHEWSAGDRFRHTVDGPYDKFWQLGTVLEQKPSDPRYPECLFRCYKVELGGEIGKTRLSPWDMEIVPDHFVIPKTPNRVRSVTNDEMYDLAYRLTSEDWQPHGAYAECKRISRLLKSVMRLRIARNFIEPVVCGGHTIQSNYTDEIAYPIDLETINARLKTRFYWRPAAILTDVEHIAMNAEKFYGTNSDVANQARVITALLQEVVKNPSNRKFGDVQGFYSRLLESSVLEVPIPKKQPKEEKAFAGRSLLTGESAAASTRSSSAGPSSTAPSQVICTDSASAAKHSSPTSGSQLPAKRRRTSSGESLHVVLCPKTEGKTSAPRDAYN